MATKDGRTRARGEMAVRLEHDMVRNKTEAKRATGDVVFDGGGWFRMDVDPEDLDWVRDFVDELIVIRDQQRAT